MNKQPIIGEPTLAGMLGQFLVLVFVLAIVIIGGAGILNYLWS